jgi:hypothetical protein
MAGFPAITTRESLSRVNPELEQSFTARADSSAFTSRDISLSASGDATAAPSLVKTSAPKLL